MGRVGNDYFTENRKSVWPAGSVGMGLVANSGGRFWDNDGQTMSSTPTCS
jgi:hypothetical protein